MAGCFVGSGVSCAQIRIGIMMQIKPAYRRYQEATQCLLLAYDCEGIIPQSPQPNCATWGGGGIASREVGGGAEPVGRG